MVSLLGIKSHFSRLLGLNLELDHYIENNMLVMKMRTFIL